MKRIIARILLAAALLSWFALPAVAQNVGRITKNARTAAAGVSVSTQNGVTTLTYQGSEVWKGRTQNQVTARSKVVAGVTYVAAFDGAKVIWENVKGAGAKVR